MTGIYFNLYLKALGYDSDLIGILSAIPAFVVGLALGVGLLAGSAVAGVLPEILGPRLALPLGSTEIYRAVIILSFGIFVLSGLPLLIGLGAGLLLPSVNLFLNCGFRFLTPPWASSSPSTPSSLGWETFFRRVWPTGLAGFFFVWGYVPSLSLAILGYLVRTALRAFRS